MRAFHFYIDDWLSSKQIRRMDAAEERGYLRLLLYAASEEDCGLPTDPNELADISLLGAQWFKPTQEIAKYFGNQTSGDKLRACFFEKDGRYFNERLLKEFRYQQEAHRQRVEASRLGVEARRRNMHRAVPEPSTERLTEQLTNDVCVCVTDSVLNTSPEEQKLQVIANAIEGVSESNNSHTQAATDQHSIETPTNSHGNHAVSKESLVLAKPGVSELGIEGWDELVELGSSVAMVMDPDPGSDLCQKFWRRQSFEGRLERIKALREKISCGQFSDPQYVPSLENFVRTKYRESHRPKAKPVDRGQALIARIRAEEAEKTAKKSNASVPIRGDP